MGLDLRLPIGLYFTLLGVMLGAYGLITASNTEMYKRSLNMNINITWGVVLLLFGLAMLIPSLIDRKKNAGK
jgi:sulfite exporter TauE/SafE